MWVTQDWIKMKIEAPVEADNNLRVFWNLHYI